MELIPYGLFLCLWGINACSFYVLLSLLQLTWIMNRSLDTGILLVTISIKFVANGWPFLL
jgi:hypothetical protein